MTTIVVTPDYIASDKRITTDTYYRDGTVETTFKDNVEKVKEHEDFYIAGSGSTGLCRHFHDRLNFIHFYVKRKYKFLLGTQYHIGNSFNAEVSNNMVLVEKNEDRILEMVLRTWRLPFGIIFVKKTKRRMIGIAPNGWMVIGSGADYASDYLTDFGGDMKDLDFDDMFKYIASKDDGTSEVYDLLKR